ncbi:MAG: hypothetical protein HN368_10230 [Spirochaetales bacterium]|jgi:hypothetical protein|nr:hypothetical protein [Spirochaetales bacterium]
MQVTLGKEKVISQAPAGISDWGPWQFPRFFAAGSKLYLEFHISADSAKSYGNPREWYVSEDKGDTWKSAKNGGLLLHNGDLIKPHQTRALPEDDVTLPECIGNFFGYGIPRRYFDYEMMDPKYKHWYIERKQSDGEWQTEEVAVELPGHTMNTSEGVLPLGYFHHFKLGPDGAVWGLLYKHFIEERKISDFGAALYVKSTDNGKTFRLISRVPYQWNIDKDPGADKRYGFAEPDICFLDAEKAFSLLRTTDGTGIGPMYIIWTEDGGYSWTTPEYFDDRGVWPQTATLENGVILAGYGRPGLFIKPYFNGKWHEKIAVVEPMAYQTDTCSYCALAAIGIDTALICYSDFNYPGPDGTPRKSIMVRTVRCEV